MATYQLISSVTVGSGGASSIDFTSIPATYTDLSILFSGRAASGSPQFLVKLNNATTNFTVRYLQGDGTSASSNNLTTGYIGEAEYSGHTANTFANVSIYIPNYASSNNKSFCADNVEENNATTAYSQLTANLWSNTAAINQVTLYCSGSINLAQYSTAYLYGIKNS